MRFGCTLPQFGEDPASTLRAAARAEASGLDAVFLFDHLWPLSGRDRPVHSPWPLLGAMAADTDHITLGTLVARVGLAPVDVLVGQIVTAWSLSGQRLIAGLGTGDHLSAAENEAFGLEFPPAEDRIAALVEVARALTGEGVPVWVAGRHPGVRQAALEMRAPLNVWGALPSEVAALTAEGHEVTWGGQVLVADDAADLAFLRSRFGTRPGLVEGTVAEVASHMGELARAGATWAVCSPLDAASPKVAGRLAQVAQQVKG